MVKRRFLFAAVFVAAILTSISMLTACEKEDEVQKDGTEQTDKKGGSAQDGDSTANVEVKIVGTQVANIGETYATLLCRFTKPDGGEFTQAEGEAIMKLNPQGGFCLVEGEGTPTIKDSTINCIETARQGGVMSGTFNNLKQGTKYTVRAWLTVDGTSIYYGEKVTFTTQGNVQPEIAISLVGMQVANVGDSYAVLLCRITKSNGETMTPAELDALMNQNPRAGFCLVKGDGTPTIKDSTINCIESARQGGVMSGTFNNLMSGTKYSVRAWLTVDGNTIYYGETATFTTQSSTISGLEMVTVQGGTFTMGATSEQGSDAYDDEYPTHSVTLSSYQIGKYEVTQKLWKEVMGTNPSYFTGDDNRPVENVSWNDVQEFITKLNARTGKNYRLPTEAEWEFAARGGKQSQGYKYSGSNTIGNVAWYDGNSSNTTHPVGQKSPNELGIYDMTGNVWEWCSDWYGSYSSSAQTNPAGPSSGSPRVLRGGGWYDYAKYCRVSYRFSYTPSYRRNGYGFRLVLSL